MLRDFGCRRGSGRLFGRAALAVCALAPNAAAADVALLPQLADAPSLSGTGSSGFYGIVVDGSGTRTLLSVGNTWENHTYDQTEIVALGPFADGVLKRSAPLLPFYTTTRAVATNDFPQPLLVTLGYRAEDFTSSSGMDVYGGAPLTHLFSRNLTGNGNYNAATLTRVAGPGDFDLVVSTTNEISLWSSNGIAPTWTVPASVTALATVPGGTPQLIASGGQVELRDLSDGHVTWSSPEIGGNKILVGKLKATGGLQFVVVGAGDGVAVYQTDPPQLLWQKTGSYVDADIADRNGDGLKDILLTDYDQHMVWLDGSGNTIGSAITTTQRVSQVGVGNIDGATPEVVGRFNPGPGVGTGVWSLDLSMAVGLSAGVRGPFDRFALGNVDDSGQSKLAEIYTLATGGSESIPPPSGIRIVDPSNGALVWSGFFAQNNEPSFAEFIADVCITRPAPGQAPVVALLLAKAFAPSQIAYVNGITHAVTRHTLTLPANRVPTHLRMVDIDGDDVPEIVLLSEPATSQASGTQVHVLRSDTFATTWSSAILAPQFPATWADVRPASATRAPRLLFTLHDTGLWSIDLSTHFVDFSVFADAGAGTYLPDPQGADRVAFMDDTAGLLRIVDAITGSDVDQVAFSKPYRALAADPADAQRLFMAAGDHLASFHLDTHRREGLSPLLDQALALGATMTSTTVAGNTVIYAGGSIGVWATTAAQHEDSILADGFETW